MEFNKVKLKEIADITMGQSPKGTSYNNIGNGVPFLQGNKTFGRLYPSIDTWTSEPNKIGKKNSILMSVRAPVGDLNIANQDICIGRGLCSIEMKNGNNQYLFYVLMNSINQIKNKSTGTVFDSINRKELEEIDVIDFNKETQEKITKVLYNLDKKIELNNQINNGLDKISQLLLENFIKESKNIEYCKIKDFNPRLETGNRPKGGVNNITTGVPSIGAESIKGLGYFDYTKTKYVTEEYFDNMKKGIIQGYELLIYKDGGKPGYFIPNFSMFGDGFPYEKCAINEHVFLLDFKDTRFNIFSYYYFNSEYIRHKLHVLGSKSAAIPGINQQDILNLEIPHIKGIDEEVLDILEANTRTIIKNSKQNVILTNMRDVLLPKLMNGEINLDKIQI